MRWTHIQRQSTQMTALCLVTLMVLILVIEGCYAWVYAQAFVGQRVKLTVRRSGDHLAAIRLREREPSPDPDQGQVEGHIDALDSTARVLRMGPIRVVWGEATQFVRMTETTLAVGVAIEVQGHLVAPGSLIAESMTGSDIALDVLAMLGTVTASERQADGAERLTLLGLPVVVPKAVYAPASALTRRLDDKRPEEQLTLTLFNRPLIIGGEVETSLAYRKNFALAEDAKDDLLRVEQEIELEFLWQLDPSLALFVEGKANYEADVYAEDGAREFVWEIERGETWLFIDRLFDNLLSVQIGRQRFQEKRAWWWDEDLDALRLYVTRRTWQAEFALAQEIALVSTDQTRLDPEDKDVLRFLGHATWSWYPLHQIDGFILYQHDHSSRQAVGQFIRSDRRDESDATLVWFGLRALGRWRRPEGFGRIDYWLDTAGVVGEETLFDFDRLDDAAFRIVSERGNRHVAGWAIDLGVSWQMPLDWRPTLTVGYALGSGDRRPEAGTDHAFRQTGLQRNKGRFRGVNRFRYYGELLRPELSNLQIWTLAFGFRFFRSSSVELLYHLYRQVEPGDFLRDARLDADPEGEKRAIGQEWDVVIGIEEWKHVELELVGSLFRAGDAYGTLSGKLAYFTGIEIDVNF